MTPTALARLLLLAAALGAVPASAAIEPCAPWSYETCFCDPISDAQLDVRRLNTPPGDDSIRWRGTLAALPGGVAVPGESGAHVLITSPNELVLQVDIPGGAYDPATRTGWTMTHSTVRWRGDVDGITELKLTTRRSGEVKLSMKARGAALPEVTALPLQAQLTLDGGCARIEFQHRKCPVRREWAEINCR